MQCPYCKNDITPDDGFCPICHSPLPGQNAVDDPQPSDAEPGHKPVKPASSPQGNPSPRPAPAPAQQAPNTQEEEDIPLPMPQILLDEDSDQQDKKKRHHLRPHALKQREPIPIPKGKRNITKPRAPSKRTIITLLMILVLGALGAVGWKYWQAASTHEAQASCTQSIKDWDHAVRELNAARKDARKEARQTDSGTRERINELMGRTILAPTGSCTGNPVETRDRAQAQAQAAKRVSTSLQKLTKRSRTARTRKQLHAARKTLDRGLTSARQLLKDSRNKVTDESTRTSLQKTVRTAEKARTLKRIQTSNTDLTNAMAKVRQSMGDWQNAHKPAPQGNPSPKPAPAPAPAPEPGQQPTTPTAPRRPYTEPRRPYSPRRSAPSAPRRQAPAAPRNNGGGTWNVPPPSSDEGQL